MSATALKTYAAAIVKHESDQVAASRSIPQLQAKMVGYVSSSLSDDPLDPGLDPWFDDSISMIQRGYDGHVNWVYLMQVGFI